MTVVWGTRRPVDRLVSELGAAVLAAVLVSVFLAPLVVGGNPFSGGASWIFIQLLFFGGVCGAGALLGYLIITIVALDYRSQNLRQVERHYGARAAARAAGKTGKQNKAGGKPRQQGGKKKSPAKKTEATPVEDAKATDADTDAEAESIETTAETETSGSAKA